MNNPFRVGDRVIFRAALHTKTSLSKKDFGIIVKLKEYYRVDVLWDAVYGVMDMHIESLILDKDYMFYKQIKDLK